MSAVRDEAAVRDAG